MVSGCTTGAQFRKIGSYQTIGASDLYLGGGKDQLVLIYALSPNVMIDRSQSVEMVVLYQTTDAGNSIRNYNRNYNRKNNNLGIMQIVDENGTPISGRKKRKSRTLSVIPVCALRWNWKCHLVYRESYQDLGADAGFP